MSIETVVLKLLRRRTKIVASLGPASWDPANIARLSQAGVNVFRLNMSHLDHGRARDLCDSVHAAGVELRLPLAVMADVGGRSMRVRTFRDGSTQLEPGRTVAVTTRDVAGDDTTIPIHYEQLLQDISPGSAILIDDGQVELQVDRVGRDEAQCTVVRGGRVVDNKGINLPGVDTSGPSLAGRDLDDARFAIHQGVDFIALSHVDHAGDIEELRDLIATTSGGSKPIGIIAKIERTGALEDYENILDAADGIMVARGDLGVELPEQIPTVQCQLIDRARAAHKPIIVATQALESMIENPVPTRAEVADVTASVMGGADAVMLSAETAVGAHPLAVIQMTDSIARQAEGYLWDRHAFDAFDRSGWPEPPVPIDTAVALAVAGLSRQLRVRAIMVLADGAVSARVVSSARPAAPIVSISGDARTCRRESLIWGVVPQQVEGTELEQAAQTSRRLAVELGLAQRGDSILLVRGEQGMDANTPASAIAILTV